MTSNQNIWIVVPSFHDSSCLRRLIQQIRKELGSLTCDGSRTIRFLIADDSAGEDQGLNEMTDSGDAVSVVQLPFRSGHQAALVLALRTLAESINEKDLVLTLDADGEDRPVDIPRLLEPLIEREDSFSPKIILAKRTSRKESLPFKILYCFFKFIFKVFTGQIVRSGNFAAFTGSTLKRMISHPMFDLCYSSSLLNLGYPIKLVGCERGSRYDGESRMNFFRLVSHGIHMLMPFMNDISVRLMIFLGSLLVTTFLFFAISVLDAFNGFMDLPKWSTIASFILLLVLLITLGICILVFSLFSHFQSARLRGHHRSQLIPSMNGEIPEDGGINS